MRKFLLAFILFVTVFSFALYIPPIDNSYITATFGEFRQGTHQPRFHFGIDFSTFLKEGIETKAVEKGYLVRLEIDKGGIYGNTVVLEHEDGYRSVYAHLSEFSPKVEKVVQMLKKEFGDTKIVIEFSSPDYSFEKGEIIGYSGKTGEAAQAHAHLEIRDKEEKYVFDPLSFLDLKLIRATPGTVILKSILIDGQEFAYNQSGTYYFSGNYPKISLEAYTEVGKNLLGVKEIKVYFSKSLVYHILLDKIPISEWERPFILYNEKSEMTAFKYKTFYNIYSDQEVEYIKVNKVSEFQESHIDVEVEVNDFLGNSGTFKIVLKRR